MVFRFENKITALDMWKLTMYHIYHSMAGACNIIFAVALILVTIKIWNPVEELMMSLLVLACVLFPVIQPLSIYMRAVKQVASLPKDMVIEIDETGVRVTGDNQKSHLPWNRIRGVIKEKNMIILAADGGRGYMLTNKTMGTQKDALLEFLDCKIEHKV